MKLSNIYRSKAVHRHPPAIFFPKPSSLSLADFVALARSWFDSSYTHHQQPSLGRFEEFLTPSIDHRRYSAVAILFLSAVVLKVRPPMRLSARGFGSSCSVSKRESEGLGRSSRCLLAGSRAQAAGTRARRRGRRGRREAPRSSMLRPSRGPIEGWNGFWRWRWCSWSPLPARGDAALAGWRWPWRAAAAHGVPRRGR